MLIVKDLCRASSCTRNSPLPASAAPDYHGTPWRSQRNCHNIGIGDGEKLGWEGQAGMRAGRPGWGEGIFNDTAQFWYKVSALLLQAQAKVVEAVSRY